MPRKWSLITPSSPEDVACILAADFIAACKADGDASNAARWANVLAELRLKRKYTQMSLFSDNQHSTPSM